MNRFIEAKPYPWPYDGNLRADNTALVITRQCEPSSHFSLATHEPEPADAEADAHVRPPAALRRHQCPIVPDRPPASIPI